MSLSNKTTIGVIWNFAEQMSKRGIGVVITLLLARFLTPDDYGLVGMMAVFIAIANQLMESGFDQSLIRKLDITQEDFNTAFYANILLGILAYIFLFSSAPFVAAFYEEARLIPLIRVVGITIIINSFQIVQISALSRDFKFKLKLKATLPATIISGIIAITMAAMGFGVWALITQMIVYSLLVTFFLWSLKLWKPTRKVSRNSFKEMFGFGSKLFASGLIDIIFQNLYIIVIAKLFLASTAGYYYFAKKIRELVLNQIVRSIQTVTYPALSTLQKDELKLKMGYKKIIKSTVYLLFPLMTFMAALAEPLFRILLNEQWLPAVPYLQLLCIGGVMYPLHSINLNILKVKGRSDLFLYIELVKKAIVIIILLPSIKYGVIGILIGQVISSYLVYIPNSYYSGKLINYSINEQIFDFLPELVLSFTISICIYFAVSLSILPACAELILLSTLAIITYLSASCILKFESFKIIKQVFKQNLKLSNRK
ncbi:lipopolysaccharide biosynthesis protein [Methanolobus sp. ZRKC5]|uniref:lipopolysaccharide biosynthesis protein n=1 Tax=unclassified Methanolobus TaxID=2629569 RepID=UPI00313E3160